MWFQTKKSVDLPADPVQDLLDSATGALKPTKESPKRIRVLPGRDRCERRYAVTRPMGAMAETDFITKPLTRDNAQFYKEYREFTPQALAAVSQIMMIEGVMQVNVQRYEVLIRIGGAFNFSDVHAAILTALRNNFFPGDDEFHAVEFEDWTISQTSESAGETAATK